MKKFILLYSFLLSSSCLAGECDFIQFNSCRSCEDSRAFNVATVDSCSFLCPGRVVNFAGSGSSVVQINCAVEICPTHQPFQSYYGNCYKTQEEADNDFGDNMKDNEDLAEDSSDNSDEENECGENHFKRWDGKCFSCDYPKAVRIQSQCNYEKTCDDVCPNRTIIKWIGGNPPSVLNCPTDKPMMDDEGICYSCDTPIPIGVQWNPDFCHRFCPNERHLDGNFCVLNTKDNFSNK